MNEKSLDEATNSLNDLFVRILTKHKATPTEARAIAASFVVSTLEMLQRSTDSTTHEARENNKYLIKVLQEHMLSKN
jgi:hypothetical protein